MQHGAGSSLLLEVVAVTVSRTSALVVPEDDEALMRRSQRGESLAFRELVERHQARVRSYLARLVGGEDARDLAQDVFVALWETRHRYEARGLFLQYLYTIATNRLRREQRFRILRERLFERSPLEDVAAVGQIAADAHLVAMASHARVAALVAALPFDLRVAVVLRCAEELEYGEIAAVVGAPEATLRSRVHRGLGVLRARLDAERGPP